MEEKEKFPGVRNLFWCREQWCHAREWFIKPVTSGLILDCPPQWTTGATTPSTLARHPSGWEGKKIPNFPSAFRAEQNRKQKEHIEPDWTCGPADRQKCKDEELPMFCRGQHRGESLSPHDNQEWPQVKTIHILLTGVRSVLWTKCLLPYWQRGGKIYWLCRGRCPPFH